MVEAIILSPLTTVRVLWVVLLLHVVSAELPSLGAGLDEMARVAQPLL